MIPETKGNAVQHALKIAFGVSEFEDIGKITIGLSPDLVFRIVVQGKPYLLRIVTRNGVYCDPPHYFACMKTAADTGIAPHIWYMSTEDRILITDFIEARDFPISEARVKLSALLRHLHSLPPFPPRVNYLDAGDGWTKKFQAAQILPESMTGELFQLYSKVINVYPRNSDDLVSCHNDLKPENIIFDGDRAWLVDWEAAFLNDRYVDLGVIANFVVMSDDDEKDYLRNYFGEEANEYQRARFFLMRQVLHMNYFTLFMLLGSAGKPVDLNMIKPGFREFHDGMWAGEIDLSDNKAKLQYAWAHMEQLVRNLRMKRLEDSLEIVSQAHVNPKNTHSEQE